VLAALRQADRIELQWFNAMALAPRLRRLLPRTSQVGVFHDVVSQGQRRMFRTPGVAPRWRLVALAQMLMAVPLERHLLRVLDTAVVVSEKDRALLQRRGGRARIVVVSPPLDDGDMPPGPDVEPLGSPEVLFVGALDRVENEDAARWLLEQIWPHVLAEVPDAQLTIAGAKPSPGLRRAAEPVSHVRITGYVDSLSPHYRRASVVVAPMRLGAGVKLKSVVAMLWGLPVVATSVAAEGVLGPEVFYAVEDDSTNFANAVVAVLKDPSSADDVRARAFVWSHDQYSTAQYRDSVEQLYPTGALPGDGKRTPAGTEKS
jgi:glycosyltransferase involved in cell wall biosynthesis